MSIAFNSTLPSPGDTTWVLLAKLLQAVGGDPDAGDSENSLLAKIARGITTNGGGASGAKVYRALITQTGTGAPVADVLENTIGDIVWTRINAGVYEATLAGAFIREKTFMNCNSVLDIENDMAASLSHNTVNSLTLVSGAITTKTLDDNVLNVTPVEIIVYP